MKKTEIKKLICPYCGTLFKVGQLLKITRNNIHYGSIVCNCDEFPILEGILILDKKVNKKIIFFLQKHEYRKALNIAIFPYSPSKISFFKRKIDEFFLNPITIKKISRKLLLFFYKILFSKKSINYFLKRTKEKSSLLIFYPLMLLKKKQENIWINVGSGIINYYDQISTINPSITFFSVENEFFNIYLSKMLFSAKNTNYICMDFNTGRFLNVKADLITCIDTVPFIKNQKQLIELVSKKYLRKNGYFFASSIIEHMYLSLNSISYPISKKVISSFFPSKPLLLNDWHLLENLSKKRIYLKKLKTKSKKDKFRYSIVWPQPNKNEFELKVPKKLLLKATEVWEPINTSWNNKAY